MKRSWLRFAAIALSLATVGCGGGGGLGGGGQGGTGTTGGTTTIGATTTIGTGGATASDTGGTTAIGTGGATAIGTGGATVIDTGGTTAIGTGGATASDTGGTTAIGTGGATAIGTGGATAIGTGGATAVAGCDKDLSGTWDLFASSTGTGILRGTLVVAKDGFSFTAGGTQLLYTGTGTKSATWKYDGYYGPTTRLISVQNTPATVDSGSFPLALGGQWILTSASETCSLNVAPGQVTGKCTGRASDYNVGGDDWPWELLASPENRVTYTIARSAAAASQFGEFGGTWAAKSDTGSGQGCTFKLEDNTATSSCRASNSFNGNLRLTIGADCVASGVTPSGAEVSARRR
jgi:hypothetical protein